MQQMQNLLARQIWRSEGYYEFANTTDPMIKKALEVLSQGSPELSK
jgi:carboxyl-terminal processing protease